jgi:hypothetical protein
LAKDKLMHVHCALFQTVHTLIPNNLGHQGSRVVLLIFIIKLAQNAFSLSKGTQVAIKTEMAIVYELTVLRHGCEFVTYNFSFSSWNFGVR